MSIAEGLDVFDRNIFLLYNDVEQKTQQNSYGFCFLFVKFTFSSLLLAFSLIDLHNDTILPSLLT